MDMYDPNIGLISEICYTKGKECKNNLSSINADYEKFK